MFGRYLETGCREEGKKDLGDLRSRSIIKINVSQIKIIGGRRWRYLARCICILLENGAKVNENETRIKKLETVQRRFEEERQEYHSRNFLFMCISFFFFFFSTQNVYIHRSIDPLVYTSINVFIPSIEDYSNVACIIINCNKNFQIMHVFKYAWGINLFSSRIVIVNKRQYLTFIFQVLQVNNKRLKIKIKKRYHVSSSTHLRILKSRRNLT